MHVEIKDPLFRSERAGAVLPRIGLALARIYSRRSKRSGRENFTLVAMSAIVGPALRTSPV
jgi:hypothetical protein